MAILKLSWFIEGSDIVLYKKQNFVYDMVALLIIFKLSCSSTDSRPSDLDSPYENVEAEGTKSRAIYQNDVFDGGAENTKEEGQYEELREEEKGNIETEKPYSKLTRI